MWATRQVGSLAVVENTAHRREIDRELRALDPNLFLDAEIDVQGRFVWTVQEHLGSERPPHLVMEWRDRDGTPLPLTSGLVEQVKALDGAGRTVFQEVSEHNQRLREERNKRSADAYEEIAQDMVPRMSPTRSAALPRGVYLRMHRDRMRARGENV